MQAFCGGRELRSETVLLPVFWSEQNNASTLHEQHAQIAVPALADATEDRPIARRHLLRHQAEPCSEVTPFGKCSAITNGRYHCAYDDRADTRNRHQLPAALGASRQHFDLFCYLFDTPVEMPPITTETGSERLWVKTALMT
jgi:hypothetical protein